MNKNRFFNVIVAAALALMVALTLQGAIETSRVAVAAGVSNQSLAAPLCEDPAEAHPSIHRVYVEQMDTWLTYTNGVPTGVDGGLIDLLSNAQACSK